MLLALLLGALIVSTARDATAGGKCGGRFFNPVSDVDWKAMFPIKIGGVAVTPGEGTDTVSHFPLCFCGSPVPQGRDKGFFLGAGEAHRGRKAPGMLSFARGQKASPSLLRDGGDIRRGRRAAGRQDFISSRPPLSLPGVLRAQPFFKFRVHDPGRIRSCVHDGV